MLTKQIEFQLSFVNKTQLHFPAKLCLLTKAKLSQCVLTQQTAYIIWIFFTEAQNKTNFYFILFLKSIAFCSLLDLFRILFYHYLFIVGERYVITAKIIPTKNLHIKINYQTKLQYCTGTKYFVIYYRWIYFCNVVKFQWLLSSPISIILFRKLKSSFKFTQNILCLLQSM